MIEDTCGGLDYYAIKLMRMCVCVCVCVCVYICIYTYIYIRILGGIINILGGDSMDCSE